MGSSRDIGHKRESGEDGGGEVVGADTDMGGGCGGHGVRGGIAVAGARPPSPRQGEPPPPLDRHSHPSPCLCHNLTLQSNVECLRSVESNNLLTSPKSLTQLHKKH